MNNKRLARAFADGAVSGSGSNMFIEGQTIYSYGHHFPIARRVTLAGGKAIALLTTLRRSQSTARHISYVTGALCGAGYTIISTENVERDEVKLSKPQVIRRAVAALR